MTPQPLPRTTEDAPGMQISLIDSSTNTLVLRLSGELDLGNADLLSTMLADKVTRARRVVLDVSSLAFCDCAGLRAILSGRDRVCADGGNLVLSGVTSAMARLLTAARLDGALTVEASEEPVV